MPKNKDINLSVLIVSASEKLVTIVRKSLSGFTAIDVRKSAAMGRRSILERDYDLVVLDTPLPDETGEDFAIDINEKCSSTSVLVITPQEISETLQEHLVDYGILVMSKPTNSGKIDKSIRFLMAVLRKMHKLKDKNRNTEDKLEEMRIVSKAKLLLVEKKKMSEDEAHRFIGKNAMDNGVPRKMIAERIIDDLE